jgi:Mn-dependent DtxR family transcriptional regulator
MLNCEKASQLASRAMDEKLSFRQNMALKLHLLLCRSCSNFTQQLNFLREAARHSGKRIEFKLADEARRRIAKVLKDKQTS